MIESRSPADLSDRGEAVITIARSPVPLSRRQFLALSAGTAAGLWLAACIPLPPLPEPDDRLLEEIRRAANAARAPGDGIDYDPTAAFPRFARQHRLRVPVTKELEYRGYRFQGYDGGIVCAPASSPDDMRVIPW